MAGPSIFGLMIWVFYLRFTVPVLGVFYGTSLIADEVEDRTSRISSRPIQRAVLVNKCSPTCLHVCGPALGGHRVLSSCRAGSLGASFLDLLKDLASWPSAWRYGAISPSSGQFKRPCSSADLHLRLGQMALTFPGYLKKFTVAYYLQAMVPHAMPNDSVISLILGIFRENPSLPESLIWLGVILLVFLWAAAVSVERKEYVLEQ